MFLNSTVMEVDIVLEILVCLGPSFHDISLVYREVDALKLELTHKMLILWSKLMQLAITFFHAVVSSWYSRDTIRNGKSCCYLNWNSS